MSDEGYPWRLRRRFEDACRARTVSRLPSSEGRRAMTRIGIAVVRGRSMQPTYVDGDRLLVGYGLRPVAGGAHLIRLPDGPDGPRPVAVKRLTRHDVDGWWAERDNPAQGVDSWTVGAIPDDHVLARVLFRLPRRRPHIS